MFLFCKKTMQETLRRHAFLLALLLPCFCAFAEKIEIAEGVLMTQDLFNTSMKPQVACYRIPALITAPDGSLLAAMDERVPSCRDLGENPDINIVVRRSQDNGSSWSAMETVVDFERGKSASDPSMVVDETTREIFLFYNFMDHESERGVYRLHVMKSGDNGVSWGKSEDITDQLSRPGWRGDFMFITSGKGIQTRSGMLLHTLVNLKRGLHLFGSRDHGKTWFLIDTPITPGDESKVVELADGSWMINSRVKGAGMRYTHVSRDEGKTWETRPEPALPDPACNGAIIRYSKTTGGADEHLLLFSNAGSSKERKNLTVRVSYDEGKTWGTGKTIYAGETAYSDLTILDNGDIGLLFEKDDHTENVFIRFTLEWLTDGKTRHDPSR